MILFHALTGTLPWKLPFYGTDFKLVRRQALPLTRQRRAATAVPASTSFPCATASRRPSAGAAGEAFPRRTRSAGGRAASRHARTGSQAPLDRPPRALGYTLLAALTLTPFSRTRRAHRARDGLTSPSALLSLKRPPRAGLGASLAVPSGGRHPESTAGRFRSSGVRLNAVKVERLVCKQARMLCASRPGGLQLQSAAEGSVLEHAFTVARHKRMCV